MAITLADFTKIWASTSPLTPYSFSDANYQEGWNFVGATPPARQMWDGYMKFSDEKQQYIVNNFLPLTGGGVKSAVFLQREVDDSWIQFNGGTATSNGANLILFGKDESRAGQFWLTANDGNATKQLIGKADGTLTWSGKTVITQGTHIQAGRTSAITVNANSNTNVSVSFSPAFSSIPIVLATINTGYTGIFASVGSLSASGCNILITNVSNTNRSVIVGWVAIDI